MLNKNDLLKLLINSDKENFTDEEIVELLGIKVKSEGLKSSSIQSSCIFSNEVVADIDDTFNSLYLRILMKVHLMLVVIFLLYLLMKILGTLNPYLMVIVSKGFIVVNKD